MRILVGFSWGRSRVCMKAQYDAWAKRLRDAGLKVDTFCLTINPPADRLSWRDLDKRWRIGDKALLSLYESLLARLADFDVFLNYNGINTHPEFVEQLPTFNVYSCFDDPESSEDLSRPVAAAYDLAMVGNIAELKTYRSWGVKEVRWWPLGFRAHDYDPKLTRDQILNGKRDLDMVLLCERVMHFRRARVDEFTLNFPQGAYYGPGWPNGYLSEEKRVPLLQRAKIGINIHNSTGPINFRTFYLPANGILQVCDNRSQLANIYELGKEVIGYDRIEEAIDLCRYYLDHDEERRQIAAAGWERAIRDYNEVASFQRIVKAVAELNWREAKRADEAYSVLRQHREKVKRHRMWHYIWLPITWPVRYALRYINGACRFFHRQWDNATSRLKVRIKWKRWVVRVSRG